VNKIITNYHLPSALADGLEWERKQKPASATFEYSNGAEAQIVVALFC